MAKRGAVLVSAMAMAIVVLFTHGSASAVLGDGTCDQTEQSKFQCTLFANGSLGRLEIVPAKDGQWPVPGTCTDPLTSHPVPCSFFTYRFDGSPGENQLLFLVPDRVEFVFFLGTKSTGCSQLITDGRGDPTTGFGKHVTTFTVCRIVGNELPAANVIFATRPAVSDRTAVQLKAGRSVAAGEILAPFGPPPPISTIAEQIVTGDNTRSLTYQTDQEGNVLSCQATFGCTIIPVSQLQLCVPTVPNPDPTKFPTGWLCEAITHATDRCDIKTGGGDPCRFIGGKCIRY